MLHRRRSRNGKEVCVYKKYLYIKLTDMINWSFYLPYMVVNDAEWGRAILDLPLIQKQIHKIRE